MVEYSMAHHELYVKIPNGRHGPQPAGWVGKNHPPAAATCPWHFEATRRV